MTRNDRTGRATVRRTTRLAAAAALGVAVLMPTGAQAATTQYGCTFSVPAVKVSSGKAYATFSVKCSSYYPFNFDRRQFVVDVMGEDGWKRDVIDWRVVSLPGPGTSATKTFTVSGMKCDEDWGADEVFLRAHVEVRSAGWPNNWNKASWVNGPQVNGLGCY